MKQKVNLDAPKKESNFTHNHAHPFSRGTYNESPEVSDEAEEFYEEIEDNTHNNTTQSNNLVNDAKEEAKEEIKSEVATVAKSFIKKHPGIIIAFGGGILLLFIVLLLIASILLAGAADESSTAEGGYYDIRCEDVTVIMTDKSNGYSVTGTKTYSLEDYIAGVVAAEVGGFNNLEVYKTIAVAARTYLLNNDDGECTIESSDRKQVFRDITGNKNSLIYKAVRETEGQVILSGTDLAYVEYDAFCSIAVDKDYYTIKQQEQKIPRSWVDRQSGIISEWKQGTCAGNHGRGISQYGAYYLASQEDYDYDDIISYYLSDENDGIAISGGGIESIAGLLIKDTSDSDELSESLTTVLSHNGSSIGAINSYIRNNVRENGAGTREGVVTAAVSLINYLDNIGYHIPYYWGGVYQQIGVNPNFGSRTVTTTSRSGNSYSYVGLDCSGFVSWAIKNGGYNFGRHTTSSFDSSFSKDSCSVNSSSCVGEPGDLINSASCHVQLIVAVDEDNGVYYVAESAGDTGVVIRKQSMHSSNCGNAVTKILHMDSYYENENNINKGY